MITKIIHRTVRKNIESQQNTRNFGTILLVSFIIIPSKLNFTNKNLSFRSYFSSFQKNYLSKCMWNKFWSRQWQLLLDMHTLLNLQTSTNILMWGNKISLILNLGTWTSRLNNLVANYKVATIYWQICVTTKWKMFCNAFLCKCTNFICAIYKLFQMLRLSFLKVSVFDLNHKIVKIRHAHTLFHFH